MMHNTKGILGSMRHAKHFHKDLYSKWHRIFSDIAMVDVDSVECCQNKGCWKPLALIETVYDTGNYVKYTNVLYQLAETCNLPAYLVFYKPKDPNDDDLVMEFKVKRIYPFSDRLRTISEAVWVRYLRMLQSEHQTICKHGKNKV